MGSSRLRQAVPVWNESSFEPFCRLVFRMAKTMLRGNGWAALQGFLARWDMTWLVGGLLYFAKAVLRTATHTHTCARPLSELCQLRCVRMSAQHWLSPCRFRWLETQLSHRGPCQKQTSLVAINMAAHHLSCHATQPLHIISQLFTFLSRQPMKTMCQV